MSILAKLLTESEVYGPEYGGGLANHLPMALVALDQMGATPGHLNDYRRTHVSWLERLPEPRLLRTRSHRGIAEILHCR